MRLLVISSAPIVKKEAQNYLYAPYEKEMQLWAKHADTIQFCSPIWKEDRKLLIAPISFEVDNVIELQEFDITSFSNKLKAIPFAFVALIKIFKAMRQADHIHLRCPGNIALLACLVQIFFPHKQKTAKYAGNWDPKSKQPWSYRLQKWVLSNTFLTRNMQVLVYGEWEGSTKNIKSFFTATYSESEIQNSEFRIQNKLSLQSESSTTESDFDFAQSDKKDYNSLSLRAESRTNENQFKFLFIGTLSPGKQPLYAIQLVEELFKNGKNVTLELYGEGILRKELEHYITQNKLEHIVVLKGNQFKENVLEAYQTSHFLILPSKSEGWPKVVAEAMFWSCVPIASPVSCVSYMMGNGSRGVVLQEDLNQDVSQIETVVNNQELYQKMASEGQSWSRQFTTDKFEAEIKKLLRG
ncbi:glycosyltransferase [Flavobacterium sp. LMO8]|uniref:glycosyltransferase family 4 protein n=1 Tax=Flavobacterium sp. LMO8 TaxID=2654244 RepID=UPI001291DEDD|nr:glycosyltransferase [Flavobacterium sp. LMO8]MQP24777.1 glycosyltransferase [Flavobacterium sp. LMO8]